MITSYPQSEDWGWLIEYTDPDEAEIQIGCSSMASEGDGYSKKPIEWSVFVKPYTSLRERLKGVTHAEKVQRVSSSIMEALSAEGISPRQTPD